MGRLGGGMNVKVELFDSEGWQAAEGWWNPRVEDERGSLTDVIESTASIPREEADRIAGEALSEWHERGGEEESPPSVLRVVVPTFGLAALGAAALVALTAWLLLELF